jgi:cobalamin synthase
VVAELLRHPADAARTAVGIQAHSDGLIDLADGYFIAALQR